MFVYGRHKSFITGRVAQELGLWSIRQEWPGISTFGSSSKQSCLRDVVQIYVEPVGGGEPTLLDAYVVPEISRI